MVAPRQTNQPTLSRDAAIDAFRRADEALQRAARVCIETKTAIADRACIHFDELERLIDGATTADAAVAEGDSQGPSRPQGAKRRRSAIPEPALPDGATMPPPPAGMSAHPSIQVAFRRGVAAAFERAPSCPYGNRGIAAACAQAWMRGLQVGEKLRRTGGAACPSR